ncbi:MAG: beta-N-acetylhexosaminidase [Mahella sp.]|nr:beta-N-acetylhexosaminidase [Mahella sp.]MBZ4664863.1 beta-N-acetylhexosaminidase [Mahella sp.]
MRRIILITVILSIIAASLIGCGLGKNQTPSSPPKTGDSSSKPPESGTEPQAPEPPLEEKDPIEERIDAMTLDEKIGQMVIVGLDGYNIDENAKTLIEEKHVGGFILFERNVEDAAQLLNLTNSLKRANTVNKIPLFISVDEEGGRVSRMPDSIKKLPTNKAIGQINDADYSFGIGSVIGKELKAFGFNMDFAPVLDINSNPKNPVIGDRSFGADAQTVTKLGIQTMEGIRTGGVISVVKHFPGHGDTSVDSHIDLPSVNNSLERLRSFELIPFASAIENNADGIMVAHILLPKIDPGYPSSMSKKIITGILREELKYDGVILSDDLTMGAIVDNYSIGTAAVKALNAGIDIVLVCHEYENEIAVVEAIKKAANEGAISMDKIDASVYRILALKQRYALKDEEIESVDVKSINDAITHALDR